MATFKCNIDGCKEKFKRPVDLGRHRYFKHKVKGTSVTAKAKRVSPRQTIYQKAMAAPVPAPAAANGNSRFDLGPTLQSLKAEWTVLTNTIRMLEELQHLRTA